MNQTISVYSTEHQVQDWREFESSPMTDPIRAQMQAALLVSEGIDLNPGEVSFASNSMFRLHTSFEIKGKNNQFVITESKNGRYRAKSL